MQALLWQMLTRPFRTGPRRPLASRQPPRAPGSGEAALGLEAVDMALVDRVNRRNNALERVSTFFVPARPFRSFIEQSQTGVTPLPDDETYATRYHRAYIDKKGSETND